MEYITVKLTKEQASEVCYALEQDINTEYPKADKQNAFIQRIINKIDKAVYGQS